jgi:hypothetical protein
VFTVFIDDSGTDPNQKVAMASALVVPTRQLAALNAEWSTFLLNEHISSFHASVCVSQNNKSEFASWDSAHVLRATDRIRQISRKYAIKAFSFAADKSSYDATLTDAEKELFGKSHFTWALQHLLNLLEQWIGDRGVRFECVFDWMQNSPAKAEVEYVMHAYTAPARFEKRSATPGLQCVDLLAWSSYHVARSHFYEYAINAIALHNYRAFAHFPGEWLTARSITPADLRDWVTSSVRLRPDDVKRLTAQKGEWRSPRRAKN